MWTLLLALACTPDPDTADTADTGGGDEPVVVAILHGGGSEDDVIFGRMVEAAGHGHMVTLGAKEADYEYLEWFDEYFVSLGAASAETVNTLVRSDALDPEVEAALDRADGIFIRGGDQSLYVEHWQGTPVQEALKRAVERGVAVSGSSAGCAVLGERTYDAIQGSLDPWEALADAQDREYSFTDGFIGAAPGILTDTHLTERGRLPRLAALLGHWVQDGADGVWGVGVDPNTALVLWSDGTGEVLGQGSVSLLDASEASISLPAGAPPSLLDLRLFQLTEGYVVDLGSHEDPVASRPEHVCAVAREEPPQWPYLALDGSDASQRALGSWQLRGLDQDPWAWVDHALTLEEGQGDVPGAIVLTDLWSDPDLAENHLGGLLWGLSQRPGATGIALEAGRQARTAGREVVPAQGDWVLVLDGSELSFAGALDEGWQTAALEGLRLSVVGG